MPVTVTHATRAEDELSHSNDYMQQRRPAFVSYGSFLDSYWAHFPQSLTKGLGTHSAQTNLILMT